MTAEVWSTERAAPPVGPPDPSGSGIFDVDRVSREGHAYGSSPGAAVLGVLAGFEARPLGANLSDLALYLTDPVTPAAVTKILSACLRDAAGVAPSPELLRAAPVGDRIAALMAVAAATGDETFSAPVRCRADGCGEDLEVEITWDKIGAVAETTGRQPFAVDAEGVRFLVRRPDGLDQERWAHASASGAEPSPTEVIAGLLVDGPAARLTPDSVAVIEAALDEHDPLICFSVGIGCLSCGSVTDGEIPLIAIGVAALRRRQARLLEDVHDLARAYGWQEAEILAIPAWRRASYRALIAADR